MTTTLTSNATQSGTMHDYILSLVRKSRSQNWVGTIASKDFELSEYAAGIRGLLWGEGYDLLADDKNIRENIKEEIVWHVIKAHKRDIKEKHSCVTFSAGNVVFSGEQAEAIAFLKSKLPLGKQAAILGDNIAAGDKCLAIVGDHGTAAAGDYGTARAGRGGTAIVGCFGTATTGDHGTAAAGQGGSATAGHGGQAQAGIDGEIRIGFFSRQSGKYKTRLGYIGKDGLEANVSYRLNAKYEFVRA